MTSLGGASITDLTTFTVTSNGTALPGRFQVEYIDIRSMVNRITSAEVAFIDGDAANQEFASSAAPELKPGAEITIAIGYHREETVLFKGILVKQQIKVTRGGHSRVVITCKDKAFLLAQASRSAHYSTTKDADLITQLAQGAGINAQVAATDVEHTDIVQMRETDWDFIVRRAERNGLAVYTRDGELAIEEVTATPGAITLSYGRNVLDLDLQLDARLQYNTTEATSWAPADQTNSVQPGTGGLSGPGRTSVSDLATASGGQTLALRADGHVNAQALQLWASASVKRQELSKVLGTITTQGTGDVRCGNWVTLEGLGDQFNGNAFVGGIMHAVSRGNWLTTLQIGQAPQWHMEGTNPAAPANHEPTWQKQHGGLHIGIVVQLESDPDGEERILVKLPTLGDEHQGVWARMATMDAGNNRGWVIRPEIGDEVIVGFIDSNAEQPVILGRLYSSKNPSPIAAKDDNHEKGWVTRSGTKLVFNDEDVSVLLETPKGYSIHLNEKDGALKIADEHGNTWEMSKEGIAMKSPREIKIEATKDLKLKGLNVTIEADANIDVKAGANASLEGGAVTKVKGSLVQIN